MPRNGNNIYSKAAGTAAVSGEVIASEKYNSAIDDIVDDLNALRPIEVGGTGGSTPATARAALGITAAQVTAKYFPGDEDKIYAACAIGDPVDLRLSGGEFAWPGDLGLPSGSSLRGVQGKTILKLVDGANKGIITNANHAIVGGVRDSGIYIADLIVDGNHDNQTHVVGDGPGQSGVYFVNATDCVVERVTSKDNRLHGFDCDVRSNVYDNSQGDPGCENITFKDCVADGFGDDGFTVHWSRNIRFIGCTSKNALKSYSSSSNGFEVDDGSEDCTGTDCVAESVVWGFFAQGHGDSDGSQPSPPPGAKNVAWVNCIAKDCEQAGFGAYQTGVAAGAAGGAKNVKIVNGLSIDTPRALDVLNYDNVTADITHDRSGLTLGSVSVFVQNGHTPAKRIEAHITAINCRGDFSRTGLADQSQVYGTSTQVLDSGVRNTRLIGQIDFDDRPEFPKGVRIQADGAATGLTVAYDAAQTGSPMEVFVDGEDQFIIARSGRVSIKGVGGTSKAFSIHADDDAFDSLSITPNGTFYMGDGASSPVKFLEPYGASGIRFVGKTFRVETAVTAPGIPKLTSPPAGANVIWCDTSDGNRMKMT